MDEERGSGCWYLLTLMAVTEIIGQLAFAAFGPASVVLALVLFLAVASLFGIVWMLVRVMRGGDL